MLTAYVMWIGKFFRYLLCSLFAIHFPRSYKYAFPSLFFLALDAVLPLFSFTVLAIQATTKRPHSGLLIRAMSFAWFSLTVQCAYALVSHRSTSFGVSVTHRVDWVLNFFSSRPIWDSLTPSPAGEWVSPSFGWGGGGGGLHTRLRERGWGTGGSNSDEGTDEGTLRHSSSSYKNCNKVKITLKIVLNYKHLYFFRLITDDSWCLP